MEIVFLTLSIGLEHEISGKWDMIIAFPPCTYLTVTGNRWYNHEKYVEAGNLSKEQRALVRSKTFLVLLKQWRLNGEVKNL